MTLQELLNQLGRELNDFEPNREFSTYTVDMLLGFINEGLCVVASLAPSSFTTTVTAPLVAGAAQTVACCKKINKVIGVINPYGQVTPIARHEPNADVGWTKNTLCQVPGQYQIRGYSLDPSDNGIFYVSPPVPPGTDLQVEIACVKLPDAFTEADLDSEITGVACEHIANLKAWVKFEARMVDEDSQAGFRAAEMYLQLFLNLLGLQLTAKLLYELGLVNKTVARLK